MSNNVTIIEPDTAEKALNKSLEAPAIDPIILTIANEYLSGKDILSIADEFGIDPDRVTAIIEKKEVKSYIDNVYLSQGYLHRVKRLAIINDVIEQKLQDAAETGIYSKKDLLDWMKFLQEMETATKPKETQPQAIVQVNNYQRLMDDLKDG